MNTCLTTVTSDLMDLAPRAALYYWWLYASPELDRYIKVICVNPILVLHGQWLAEAYDLAVVSRCLFVAQACLTCNTVEPLFEL